MFFIFSKLLMFLITPLIWIITLLLFSLFSRKKKVKKISFITAILLLFLFSNSFILDEFVRRWEIPAKKYEELDVYDYGVVLSGVIGYDKKLNRIQYNRSIDRILQAMDLYRNGKIKKIFLSGNHGSLLEPFEESRILKDFLVRQGLPEKDILYEAESRNTRENAVETANILVAEKKQSTYLLITSAFHMKRALKCFKKAGINAIPFSTDRISGPRKFVFDHLFIPNVDAFSTWTMMIHEWTGYVVYLIMGYI